MIPITNPTTRTNGRVRRGFALVGALVALHAATSTAHAQRAGRKPEALRGSRASVEKMYDFARRYRFPFYLTPATLDDAIAKDKPVPLTGDESYELAGGVGFSYATLEARDFIMQFGPQYLAACGTPLTVTSAARPLSRQPRNANPHSVHPTGIAVDIRRPYPGPCLTWVRSALSELERRGFVEATEEHHPVHIHLAILESPGTRFRLPDLTNGVVVARQAPDSTKVTSVANGQVSLPSADASARDAKGRVYLVRRGDTRWGVAQMAGVSVRALARINQRSPRSVLQPGTTLTLPDPGDR